MAWTVLIVDDHAGFRGFARRLLEADGFTVVGEAGDGNSALGGGRRSAPEIVLLDVVLPDIDGFAVAERLAENGACTDRRAHLEPGGGRLRRASRAQPGDWFHPQGRLVGCGARRARRRGAMSRRLLVALAVAGAAATATAIALVVLGHGFDFRPGGLAQDVVTTSSAGSGSSPG